MASAMLRPGVFTELAARLTAELEVRATAGLAACGQLVEDQARASVTAMSHPYGTRTPASPGGPPAKISGTLAGSLTHTTPEGGLGALVMRVGTRPGQYPPYGRSRTPSSLYGYYLEKQGAGRSRVTYPFLMPAYAAVAPAMLAAWKAAFAGFGHL